MTYDERRRVLDLLQRLEDGYATVEQTAQLVGEVFPPPPRFNCYELKQDAFGEYVELAGTKFYRTLPE